VVKQHQVSPQEIESAPVAPQLACLQDYVRHWGEARPDAEATIHGSRRMSYRKLASEVERFAAALRAFGIEKGDRIAMLSSPRPEYLLCLLAVASIGAIWVGLHPRYKLGEFRHVLGETRPKLVFGFGTIDGRNYAEEMTALAREFPAIATFVTFDEGWRRDIRRFPCPWITSHGGGCRCATRSCGYNFHLRLYRRSQGGCIEPSLPHSWRANSSQPLAGTHSWRSAGAQ